MASNHMDATLAALQVQGRQGAATGTDDVGQQIARDCRLENERQKARRWMEQTEIFSIFGATTTNDDVFLTLQTVGFKAMGVQVIPGSRWRGTQDKGELVFDRHDYDRWRERFDTVAQRMGYTKTR